MTIESSLGGAFSTNNATLSLDFDGSVTFPEVLPYPIASVYEESGSYKIYFEEGSPAVFAVNVVGSASQVEFLKHSIKNSTNRSVLSIFVSNQRQVTSAIFCSCEEIPDTTTDAPTTEDPSATQPGEPQNF